jgi:protein-S-isoprenylcysteine O-methyltransferase Ste14
VSAGPYKFVRNPMYIGGFLLLAGFGLIQRSLAILLFALALLGLFHLFVVFVEEPGLKKRFGQSYLDYKQIVKRWLPRFL